MKPLKRTGSFQSKYLVNALAFSTLSLLGVSFASAYERQHDVHLHGEGHINLVLEQDQLQAEMRFPMKDIVGFEHAPRSDADHSAIKQAVATLQQASSQITLSAAAECKLISTNVVIGEEEEHEAHHGEDDHHKEHDHHEEHDHYDKHADEEHHHEDEHKHAHHEHKDDHHGHKDEHHEHDQHQHAEDEEHQDVSVAYRWDCHHPEELKLIQMGLFSAFPSLESVQVQVLYPAGALSETLNAGKTALTLP